MKKFISEFKAFALKGNMIDMAIGVIIGGAFTALVGAFTANIVNPLLALIPGVNSLDNSLKIVLLTPYWMLKVQSLRKKSQSSSVPSSAPSSPS